MLKIVDSVNENIIMENLNNRIDSWYFALEGMYYRCGYYQFSMDFNKIPTRAGQFYYNYHDYIHLKVFADLEDNFRILGLSLITIGDFN